MKITIDKEYFIPKLPQGEWILLKVNPPSNPSKHIHILEHHRDDDYFGTVVEAWKDYDNGKYISSAYNIEPGDFIYYSKYTGRKIEINGEHVFHVIEPINIMGIVKKES